MEGSVAGDEVAHTRHDEDAGFGGRKVPKRDDVLHRGPQEIVTLGERKPLQQRVLCDGDGDEPDEHELYELEGALDALEADGKPAEDEADAFGVLFDPVRVAPLRELCFVCSAPVAVEGLRKSRTVMSTPRLPARTAGCR